MGERERQRESKIEGEIEKKRKRDREKEKKIKRRERERNTLTLQVLGRKRERRERERKRGRHINMITSHVLWNVFIAFILDGWSECDTHVLRRDLNLFCLNIFFISNLKFILKKASSVRNVSRATILYEGSLSGLATSGGTFFAASPMKFLNFGI